MPTVGTKRTAPPGCMTKLQLAHALGVTPMTIDNWRIRGDDPLPYKTEPPRKRMSEMVPKDRIHFAVDATLNWLGRNRPPLFMMLVEKIKRGDEDLFSYGRFNSTTSGPRRRTRWTYRLEVNGQTVNMDGVPNNEVIELGRCLRAALPAGTRVEYRCVQLKPSGENYPSWPCPMPRNAAALLARGQELALRYDLL
jgi:hypothetical protein